MTQYMSPEAIDVVDELDKRGYSIDGSTLIHDGPLFVLIEMDNKLQDLRWKIKDLEEDIKQLKGES